MIGIFDAGVGGLSVLKALQAVLPGYAVGYLADTGRFPYSPRPLEEKLPFSIQDTEFLVEQGAGIIAIACNAITCFAGEPIRAQFSLPVFDVISAGARAAVNASASGRIGVVGSVHTGSSPAYPEAIRKLKPDAEVTLLGSQLMVYLVEEGVAKWPEIEPLIKRILAPLAASGIDTLVMGCTHFPFMRNAIETALPAGMALVDPGMAVAREIKAHLAGDPELAGCLQKSAAPTFYVSGSAESFRHIAGEYIGPVDPARIQFLDWSTRLGGT